MKQKSIFIGAVILCTVAATICGCSNENNELIPAPGKQENSLLMTVGAPTITDGAQTRVSFDYSDGLVMSWVKDDVIKCSGFRKDNAEDSWARSFTRDATAQSDGTSVEFIQTSPWSDLKNYNYYTYTITYHGSTSFNPSGEIHHYKWLEQSIPTVQTQTGNDNKKHLKDNYYAVLQNVNTFSDIAFSTAWASSHAATAASYIPTGDSDKNKTMATTLGTFYQSSCVKFDLTLPVLSTDEDTPISKIVLSASSKTPYDSENMYSAFYTTNRGSGAGNTITLNLTEVTVDADAKGHVVGYIMLPVYGLRYSKDHTWRIAVYYGDGTDYIYKDKSFAGGSTLCTDGKLYVIKLNSSSWNPGV